MIRITRSLPRAARRSVGFHREIGPIGTASRIAVGVTAVATPIAISGIGWWEAAASLVGFPVAAAVTARVVTAGYRRWAPRALARGREICSGPTCVMTALLFGIALALGALTPVDGDVAFWVWIGASMILAAMRGYAGCELLAFPNVLTGRRDQIGCILFTPIDVAEASRRRHDRPVPAGR